MKGFRDEVLPTGGGPPSAVFSDGITEVDGVTAVRLPVTTVAQLVLSSLGWFTRVSTGLCSCVGGADFNGGVVVGLKCSITVPFDGPYFTGPVELREVAFDGEEDFKGPAELGQEGSCSIRAFFLRRPLLFP